MFAINKPSARITALGHFLPASEVSSSDVERRLAQNGHPIPEGMIQRLSGVAYRRYSDPEVASSDLAAEAAKGAMRAGKVDPESIDLLIFAAASHDVAEPATANIVQAKIGCFSAHALDVKNACNSFLNALDIACSFIQTGRAQRILITSGEVLSPVIDWKVEGEAALRRKFAALTLGDAGGACLVEPCIEDGRGIFVRKFFTEGTHWQLSTVMSGGTLMKDDFSKRYFDCDSTALYALALKHVPPLISEVLSELNWELQDVQLVVPHQASRSIIEQICRAVDYPIEKCFITLERLGNVAAASIPVSLSMAAEAGRLNPGAKVLLVSAAAGFSAGVVALIV